MKNRFFPLLFACALILNTLGAAFADTKSGAGNNQANSLVGLLPASDAVVAFEAKRFMSGALPQILSGNQPLLAKVLAHIDEVKSKTGIDLRSFERVAAGITAKKISDKNYEFEPAILARGQINSSVLLSAAKLAANGKYREEKVGGKTIFIFAAKEIAAQNKPQATTGVNVQMIDKFVGKLSQEIAVAAFDANTLVFGSPQRIRQTLEGKTRVGADVTDLINRNPGSIMTFAAKLPGGMSQFLPLDNDELGKNIDSIQYVYGSMDVVGDASVLQLTAKTQNAAQAQGLLETLEGLQFVGKAFLGSSKDADKQVYGRMIENAKFIRTANEVKIDLRVPQSDINVLIGGIK